MTPSSINEVESRQIANVEAVNDLALNKLYLDNPSLFKHLINSSQGKGASYFTLFNAESSELIGWSSLFV